LYTGHTQRYMIAFNLLVINAILKISITSLQEKEFLKMFQVPVIEVPTNLPNIRKDLPIQAFAVVVFFFF